MSFGRRTFSSSMAPVATTFQSSGLAVTHIYDANGNTTAMTDPLGNLVGLGYDDRNLLTVVQSSGTTIANYQYDGLGIRVWRTITSPSAGTAATVYDPAGTGNLYGEYFAADFREYVYVNGIPVATASDAGRAAPGITYLYADHLGTIRAAIAPAGGTAYTWAWQNNAFGNQIKSGGDNFYNRFPGQYYDVETGLHYNVNRYYDPAIGRYIQSDPIGLAGGASTYDYAGANPLGFIDPTGLEQDTVTAFCIRYGPEACAEAGGALSQTGSLSGGAVGGAAAAAATASLSSDSKPCSDDNCAALIAKIERQVQGLETKYNNMLDDEQGLYLNAYDSPTLGLYGAWVGHVTYYEGLQVGLRAMIRDAEAKGCPVPPVAYEWAVRPAPIQPRNL
jgi:RHS repeat-associated protein